MREMRNGREIRANELQAGNRRRRRAGSRTALFVTAVIFAVLLFYMRDIRVRLKEVQDVLEKIELSQSAGAAGGGWGQSGDLEGEVQRTGENKASRTDEICTAYVERPMQRSLEETMQKLTELAQTNPTIAGICENSSMYQEKMLMALANNPEMADFVAGYPDRDLSATGTFTDDEKEKECPLLLQWDGRWGYQPYGDMNIGMSGCGPTCLSMVLYALTRDEDETPPKIAAYAMENGYYVQGTGTAWALMTDYPARRGVHATETRMEESSLKTALDLGNLLICAMGPGDFTVSGHFIVIYDYDEEGFFVNDPNCVARSRQKWPFETLDGQVKNIWAYWYWK